MFWREQKATATARTYARAALVGNPSDGYGGRTIAFAFQNLYADVTVSRSDRLVIDAERGEAALLRAAYGRFAAHCVDVAAQIRPCSIRVRSSIPPEVGLAGSSAIVIGALRALCEFNNVEIPDVDLPTVALAAEEDIDIPAGLQDRVAQVYEGLVYMDFDPAHVAANGHGVYERLDPKLLEHAYVAWCPRLSVTGVGFHRELRQRFRNGDDEARAALRALADLARDARGALRRHDLDAVHAIVDQNFDLRRKLGPLEPHHVRMVEVARATGASANYTGSGGAITGFVKGEDGFAELCCAMAGFGCTVIRPALAG